MKINSVNVIEYKKGNLESVKSFSIDPEGVAEAEKVFSDILREHGEDEGTIEDCLDDGIYEDTSCDYQLFLHHS